VTAKVKIIAVLSGLAVVGMIVGMVVAFTHGSSNNPYRADYAQGERQGRQFMEQWAGTLTYNVESSPAQCQQDWSLVNSTLTGEALSNLRRGFMDGCEIAASQLRIGGGSGS
jgi:hypothetical protein